MRGKCEQLATLLEEHYGQTTETQALNLRLMAEISQELLDLYDSISSKLQNTPHKNDFRDHQSRQFMPALLEVHSSDETKNPALKRLMYDFIKRFVFSRGDQGARRTWDYNFQLVSDMIYPHSDLTIILSEPPAKNTALTCCLASLAIVAGGILAAQIPFVAEMLNKALQVLHLNPILALAIPGILALGAAGIFATCKWAENVTSDKSSEKIPGPNL